MNRCRINQITLCRQLKSKQIKLKTALIYRTPPPPPLLLLLNSPDIQDPTPTSSSFAFKQPWYTGPHPHPLLLLFVRRKSTQSKLGKFTSKLTVYSHLTFIDPNFYKHTPSLLLPKTTTTNKQPTNTKHLTVCHKTKTKKLTVWQL